MRLVRILSERACPEASTVQLNRSVPTLGYPLELAPFNAIDAAAITRHFAFIFEIEQSMIRQSLGDYDFVRRGNLISPGEQHLAVLEHEVEMCRP